MLNPIIKPLLPVVEVVRGLHCGYDIGGSWGRLRTLPPGALEELYVIAEDPSALAFDRSRSLELLHQMPDLDRDRATRLSVGILGETPPLIRGEIVSAHLNLLYQAIELIIKGALPDAASPSLCSFLNTPSLPASIKIAIAGALIHLNPDGADGQRGEQFLVELLRTYPRPERLEAARELLQRKRSEAAAVGAIFDDEFRGSRSCCDTANAMMEISSDSPVVRDALRSIVARSANPYATGQAALVLILADVAPAEHAATFWSLVESGTREVRDELLGMAWESAVSLIDSFDKSGDPRAQAIRSGLVSGFLERLSMKALSEEQRKILCGSTEQSGALALELLAPRHNTERRLDGALEIVTRIITELPCSRATPGSYVPRDPFELSLFSAAQQICSIYLP